MEPVTPSDPHKVSFKILEMIKQHPVLYINDVKGIDGKLHDFRQKVWQYIADDLKLDVNWVKTRWKNLRDTYCRIVKYKNKPNKGVRRKKWIYEDHLSFLTFPFEPNYEEQTCVVTKEYVKLMSKNTISSQGLLDQLEDKNDENYSEFFKLVQKPIKLELESSNDLPIRIESQSNANVDKDILAQQIEAKFVQIRPKDTEVQLSQANVISVGEMPVIISPDVEPAKKKRKLQNNNTVEVNKMKNSLEAFFESMVKTVRKFPHHLQTDVKLNICKAIAEAEAKSQAQGDDKKLDPVHTLPKLLLIPCHMIDKVK